MIEAMNLPVLTAPAFEADDVMATVAAAAESRGLNVLLATTDKDCRQLITDRVRLFNLRKRVEYGREELFADWGVTPHQVVDFQALVGDSVDNVPGVPGVGPKTAAKLLAQFGNSGTFTCCFGSGTRIAELREEFGGGLRADAGHSGDIVSTLSPTNA